MRADGAPSPRAGPAGGDRGLTRIAVVGLGYVGLPLAVALGRLHPTLGFDLDPRRVSELARGHDASGELAPGDIAGAGRLAFTGREAELAACDVYVVAVPTPIDARFQPDLAPLLRASEMVGRVLARGDVVIFESTVYPGATEEDCVPVLERASGLRFNQDFTVGYSPERISPGDRGRGIGDIVKVTSGSTPETAAFVDALYRGVIPAGTHPAPSIKVAEAAKIIENTQRDVNIALVNEFSVVFSHLGIDTAEVIAAASTKWNFVRLTPGLVGGHCIGVDPYYLMHRAQAAGHVPDIIRRAREINEGMAKHAATLLVKAMIRRDVPVRGARVLILGLTFKENCADTRNTKVVDLVRALGEYDAAVEVHDPWADPDRARREHGLTLRPDMPDGGAHDAAVLAVPHEAFLSLGPERLRGLVRAGGVFFDLKSALRREEGDLRL